MICLSQNIIKTILLLIIVLSSSLLAQHTPYWNHKASMFSILPNQLNEIIFLGDSITDRCEWFELFSNPAIRNRGLSGDKTSGVLDRLTEVTESKPDKIFIMIGVNDLRHDIQIDTITTNYRKIVKRILSESPKTKVYLQSCLPVNNKIGTPKTENLRIDNLNDKIKTLSEEYNVPYIDINSHMLNAKQRLDAKYSEDGLHINGAGYLVWKSIIEEYVNN